MTSVHWATPGATEMLAAAGEPVCSNSIFYIITFSTLFGTNQLAGTVSRVGVLVCWCIVLILDVWTWSVKNCVGIAIPVVIVFVCWCLMFLFAHAADVLMCWGMLVCCVLTCAGWCVGACWLCWRVLVCWSCVDVSYRCVDVEKFCNSNLRSKSDVSTSSSKLLQF